MEIVKRIAEKNNNMYGKPPVTIAFLGDSVTHGCFECYYKIDGSLDTVYDFEHSFANKVRKIFNYLYPAAQINIVNAGISGDCAPNGLIRFERDVAPSSPDLVVVSYGLNDCSGKEKGLDIYIDALKKIFSKVIQSGAECIFLTPNLMNDNISPFLPDKRLEVLAEGFMDNCLDLYITEARKLAEKMDVPVCDVYEKWIKMRNNGVNITELLANKLNHPSREMTSLTAMSLIETMFG